MVRVKFTHCLSGNGFVWNVGDVVELPADEAARLVAADFGELVEGETLDAPAGKPARGGRRVKSQPLPTVVPPAEVPTDPPADPPA
jgi:hypothetical protein